MAGDRILIFCSLPEGGIAEHTHYQANALADAGVETVVLTGPGFLPDHADKRYRVASRLLPIYLTRGPRPVRAAYFAAVTVLNQLILAAYIVLRGHRRVFLAATSETLALLWVWPHVLLRALGVRYAANIHDPQRKRLEGSALLHRWSIRASFLPIELALIHEDFDTDQPDIPSHVRCLRVPYAPYEASILPGDGDAIRADMLAGGSNRRIFLAFGYIANRKNLDLCIRALAQVPDAALLVAGRVPSRHDRPVSYYTELAKELGCADRVRIDAGFIAEDDIRHYFGASDAILLSYAAEFVSQSGVLLLASNWDKPVVASSGPGPLTHTVRKYGLGPAVPPDDVAALRGAMAAIIAGEHAAPGWAGFRAHASWERNVAQLREAFARTPAAQARDKGSKGA